MNGPKALPMVLVPFEDADVILQAVLYGDSIPNLNNQLEEYGSLDRDGTENALEQLQLLEDAVKSYQLKSIHLDTMPVCVDYEDWQKMKCARKTGDWSLFDAVVRHVENRTELHFDLVSQLVEPAELDYKISDYFDDDEEEEDGPDD